MGKMILAALLISLAGCTSVTGSFCSIAAPISLSERAIKAMTDSEVAAALAHNEKGAALCGWKPPARKTL